MSFGVQCRRKICKIEGAHFKGGFFKGNRFYFYFCQILGISAIVALAPLLRRLCSVAYFGSVS